MNRREVLILLVEDNPDDVELTLKAFEKHKLTNDIIVARDGEEALSLLFPEDDSISEPCTPDLILLDLKLPKVDGLEVLSRIKSDPVTKLIPVVVLTSSNEEKDLTESYRLGVNSYIRKPVDFEKFTQAIIQLGMYWLLLNESPVK
ncbi:MAG: response regulator [Candidatus Aegiribacteria sp.]|nr:response regulator [Candidatus Aegiribacteria sp.]